MESRAVGYPFFQKRTSKMERLGTEYKYYGQAYSTQFRRFFSNFSQKTGEKWAKREIYFKYEYF